MCPLKESCKPNKLCVCVPNFFVSMACDKKQVLGSDVPEFESQLCHLLAENNNLDQINLVSIFMCKIGLKTVLIIHMVCYMCMFYIYSLV